MANQWFRMYSDFINNETVEFLAFEDQRHYVFLLCMKNAGILDKHYPKEDMLDSIIARKLGLYGEAFDNAKKRIMEVGLIDEGWQPTGWDARQFITDSNEYQAEKQKRYREKKRLRGKSNGVTTALPHVYHLDTDTDTDTEADKKTYVGFESFWDAYPKCPRKQGRSKCLEIWKRKNLENSTKEILEHLEYSKAEWLKGNNQYVPMTQSYLNKEGWDGWEKDEPAGFDWTEK